MKSSNEGFSKLEVALFPLRIVGWVLVLGGLILASCYGNGDEIQRMAPASALCCTGGILAVLGAKKLFGSISLGLSLLCLLLYSWWSIYKAPVPDLARAEGVLLGSAVCSFLAAGACLREKWARWMLLTVLIGIFVAHFGFSLVQKFVDEEASFFRLAKTTTVGVSGLVFHRNYLAGYLEFFIPVVTALLFFTKGLARTFWGALICLALLLLFWTNSRAGFAVAILGGSVTAAYARWLQPNKKSLGLLGKLVLIGGGLLVMLITAVLFHRLVMERAASISGAFTPSMRLSMWGVAMELWFKEPIFGVGPQAFSYLVIKHFPIFNAGAAVWLGNPVRAHSDVLQLLAEYGIIGLSLLALFGTILIRGIFSSSHKTKSGNWMRAAALGAFVAALGHSLVDFNLHLLPNLLAASLMLAGASAKLKGNRIGHILTIVLVALGATLALSSSKKEILNSPKWFEIEQARIKGQDDYQELLENYIALAPEHRMMRKLSRLKRDVLTEKGKLEKSDWDELEPYWKKCVNLHPLDGESLAVYARILDEQGRFDEAYSYHKKAVEATHRREGHYGALYGYGLHLLKMSKELWEKQQFDKALWCLKRSQRVLDESRKKNFTKEPQNLYETRRKDIAKSIEILEASHIQERSAEPELDWE